MSGTHPGIDWSKSDRKGQVRAVEHRGYLEKVLKFD